MCGPRVPLSCGANQLVARVGYQRRSSIADQGHHLRAEIAEDPPRSFSSLWS